MFFLAIGAVITFAVSWALAMYQGVSWKNCDLRERSEGPSQSPAAETGDFVIAERFSATGAAFFEANLLPGSGTYSTFSFDADPEPQPEPIPEALVPEWLHPIVLPWNGPQGDTSKSSSYVHVTGWPMLALYSTYDFKRGADGLLSPHSHGAISFEHMTIKKGSWVGAYPATLPLRPHLLGFTINTLMYSFAVAFLWLSVASLRRAVRNRNNRCQKCGYDLRAAPPGSPCPECGGQ